MLSRGHRTLDKYLILIEFTHLVGFSERGRCRNDILKKDVCNHKRHSRPWLLEVQLLCNFCCAFLFQCSDNSLILIYCPLNVPSLFIWKSTDSGMFRQQQCLLGDWVLTFDFISLKKKKNTSWWMWSDFSWNHFSFDAGKGGWRRSDIA